MSFLNVFKRHSGRAWSPRYAFVPPVYENSPEIAREASKVKFLSKKVEREEPSPNSPKMVQGIDIVQVDVAFLTYNPTRPLTSPIVKLDSVCTAGLHEIRKHRELKRVQKYEMGSDAYRHYKWYNSILRTEIQNHEVTHTKLKILHWHIESSNRKAFVMEETTYKAVSIIISPTTEYWYCSNTGPSSLPVYGSRPRPAKTPQFVCSPEFCANNCEECKGLTSPPSQGAKKPKCACFIAKKLEKISEVTEDRGQAGCLSLSKALAVLDEKRNVLRGNGSKQVEVPESKRS